MFFSPRLRRASIAVVFCVGCAKDPRAPAETDDAAMPNDAATPHDTRDAGPLIEPDEPAGVDVTLDVRSDRDRRPISPLIYGSNRSAEIEQIRYTVLRSGGNRLTAYNWETNASNAGSDFMFQNDGYLSDSDTPAKAVTDMLDIAKAARAAAVVTVPIVDYVSADKNGGGDVRNSGADYLQTRFKKNQASKGTAFTDTPDTDDDSVYQDEFVALLKKRYADSQLLFSLDNEPDLWASTHAELHPEPVTYAELWERNHRFAKAIKAAWPKAEVTGVVSYGYTGYVSLQNAPDAAGRDFIEWYLDQAKAAEAADGMRVIDYLDLHWYPEARGGGTRITEAGDGAALIEAREQAPRSLWDSSFTEDSWIISVTGAPIDLLHRIQKKIDAHYPGTKLAFTEWNYGGGNNISGAIAVADVLGIFGREGVALATEWPLAAAEVYVEAAFRAYRNYDGKGGAFGDTSVRAQSSDVERVTAYASVDSQHAERLTLVVINKAKSAVRVGASIAHSALTRAAIYQMTAADSELRSAGEIAARPKNAFMLELPAQSVTVVVADP